jgi:acetylserotonin N-methyltransferase
MVNPELVLDLIQAFRRSKTMFAAVSLGVFDALHERPADARVLAAACGADPDAFARLLEACAGLGLLHKQGDLYSNTATAETYLRRDSPQTLAGYVLYSDQVLYQLWGKLDEAIVEGTHRWKQVFGGEGGIFDSFFRTGEARQTFLKGMHGFGLLSSPAVVRVFNLARFRRICDLGGASGHLALSACERYGAMHGIVFDLPQVIPTAAANIASSPVAARVQVVGGDFFRDPLPPADLYAVSRILHDWSEEKIRGLLTRIHAALPSGGGLLVAEALLDDDRTGPVPVHMQSLNMLVCTEGKERTEAEYRRLLEDAGFTGVEARRTGLPLDALLAVKE